MNVWIFVISTVFSPMFEPLGIDAAVTQPASVPAPAEAMSPIDLEVEDMRYAGLERMLAELEAKSQ